MQATAILTPKDAPNIKMEATKAYGGTVVPAVCTIDTTHEDRVWPFPTRYRLNPVR
jgi:threonine dehydratase